MATSIIIPKDPVYPPSMNWSLLRQEGIRHIEQLSSDIWTDYNLHDPGITILEILCYAITDLGYRANFPSADLFASPDGGKAFFTAAEILPCGPVTAFDYRKLLIDIPGVRNAWVQQQEKADVRYYFSKDPFKMLPSALRPYLDDPAEAIDVPVVRVDESLLAAIYACQTDKSRQKSRDAFTKAVFTDKGFDLTDAKYDKIKKALILYMAHRCFEEARYFLECQLPGDQGDHSLTGELTGPVYDANAFDDVVNYFSMLKELRRLRKAYLEGTVADFDWDTLMDLIKPYDAVQRFLIKEPLVCLMMAESLSLAAMPEGMSADVYSLFKAQGVYTITLRLEPGQEENEHDIIQEALRLLHLHRNLGEDISPKVEIVETIDIGIDLSLSVDPSLNVLSVMAAVYHSIEEYLSPTIPFYSLEQRLYKYAGFLIDAEVLVLLQDAQIPDEVIAMLSALTGDLYAGDAAFLAAVAACIGSDHMDDYYADIFTHAKKQYDSDPVYQGPLLTNGFIDDDALTAAQPRQTVYRSDLYRLIAAVPGVLQVVKLEMFNCKDPDHSRGNWCLAFPCRCLPQLRLDCCILAIRNGSIDSAVDLEKLQAYMEAHPPVSTRIDRSGMQDLPVPAGNPRGDLTEYTSIQLDMPRTYKVGDTGISNKESDLRKAQVRQLQGYLSFFDQLLSNYLAYLGSIRSMLSVQSGDLVSYQPLYDVPGIADLLLDLTPGEDWAAFTADPNNGYMQALKRLAQGSDADAQLFSDKVLDHLLARFGESFTDYTMQLYRIDRPVDSSSAWDDAEGLADDIADKQRFLQQLPVLGADRAKGSNFHFAGGQAPAFWNTQDTEGVRKRVCAILGIRDSSRHTITCEPAFVIEVDSIRGGADNNGKSRYEYYLKASDKDNTRLLVSTAKFSSVATAEKAGTDFRNIAVEKSNYGSVAGSGGNMQIAGFWANVGEADRTADNALMLEPFESADDPAPRVKRLQDLASGNCEDDSFHLVEHILLRPTSEAFNVILQPMIASPGEPELLDPYSFWITVVLPDWTARFSDEGRRNAFMQTFQAELPAHLEVRFVRLSRDQLFRFEQAYYDWLQVLCSGNADGLPAATDLLTDIMNHWDDTSIDYFSKIIDK